MKTTVLLLLAAFPFFARAEPPLGEWEGRSTCLVAASPCNHEHVIYTIVPGSSARSVSLAMDKVVGAERGTFVTLECDWDEHGAILRCPMKGHVWTFRRLGRSLDGDLVLDDGRRYREIHVLKRP